MDTKLKKNEPNPQKGFGVQINPSKYFGLINARRLHPTQAGPLPSVTQVSKADIKTDTASLRRTTEGGHIPGIAPHTSSRIARAALAL